MLVDNNVRAVEKLIAEPTSVAETGLPTRMIGDLCVKLIYQYSILSAQKMAESIRLPYYGVIEPVLVNLRKAEMVDIGGQRGLGEIGYEYILTPKGRERVREILDATSYIGPAPVSLTQYNAVAKAQSIGELQVSPQQVRAALREMVLGEDMIDLIGPAVNTGRSMFLYGPPGNGKSLISEKITALLGGDIYIPYAIESDGFVIKMYDPNLHELVSDRINYSETALDRRNDGRWILCKRPSIVVGGELTLDSLDLIFDETARYYEAPFQLKANNGMFLIDDFGRQAMRPRDLLNRWIVPLEKRADFLTLRNGKKIEVPFDQLLVFSTNLAPRDLVDEAFLRRIQNKIEVRTPTFEEYREIMRRNCAALNVPYNEEGVVYLLREHYIKAKRELRAVHPRDLLKQIIGFARYDDQPPALSKEYIDKAIKTYFVEL